MIAPADSVGGNRNFKQTSAKAWGRVALRLTLLLARLLWAATAYLGRLALDLIYLTRLALIHRALRKFPERAGALDAKAAVLREQKVNRWSPWEELSVGQRLRIRAVAALCILAMVLGSRTYMTRQAASSGIASGGARLMSHAEPTPGAHPTGLDPAQAAADFLKQRHAFASDQWIVYGAKSAESTASRVAEARAQPVLSRGDLNQWDDFRVASR